MVIFSAAFTNRNASGPSACFAEQLKQVLAEREMRSVDSENGTSAEDGTKGKLFRGVCKVVVNGM